MNQPTAAPTRKVTAGALAAALTTILVWVLSEFAGVELPPEVAAAVTSILTLGAAYIVPERAPTGQHIDVDGDGYAG